MFCIVWVALRVHLPCSCELGEASSCAASSSVHGARYYSLLRLGWFVSFHVFSRFVGVYLCTLFVVCWSSGNVVAGERCIPVVACHAVYFSLHMILCLFFLSIGWIFVCCEVAFDLVFSGCVTCVLVLSVIPWVVGYVVCRVACFSFEACSSQVTL